jgi:hypothetical protein
MAAEAEQHASSLLSLRITQFLLGYVLTASADNCALDGQSKAIGRIFESTTNLELLCGCLDSETGVGEEAAAISTALSLSLMKHRFVCGANSFDIAVAETFCRPRNGPILHPK